MSFIKMHLISLICGLVVVSALVAYFLWPLPSYSAALRTNEESSIKRADVIKQSMKLPIEIPGQPARNGPITQAAIDAKNAVQADMSENARKIAELASHQNEVGRVIRDGKKVTPLLDGQPEPNYLPTVVPPADPNDFADKYNETFDRWTSLLARGTATVPSDFDPAKNAAAPTKTEVEAEWTNLEAKRVAALPRAADGSLAIAGSDMAAAGASANFARDFVNRRASEIRMYVVRDLDMARSSFQIRPKATNEAQIFEQLVDCWLQMDVVHAIDAVNRKALEKLPPESQNVSASPIKRLTHITVGAGVGTGSALFLQGDKRAAAGAVLDYGKGMTGRIGTDKYDVTTMSIEVDIDPSYINAFIAEIYRQNNSYTVLNTKITTVDPFIAASNGYIYGPGQVVTVDLQVEAILFRGWTSDIIPPSYKSTMGVP